MQRELFEDEHEQLRSSFRSWLADEVVPHLDEWDRAGIVPREVFASAGEHGFLGFDIPEEYGGGGVSDFRNNLVVIEEIQAAGTGGAGLGLTLHNDICLPYFMKYCTEDQRARWLPGIASGDLRSYQGFRTALGRRTDRLGRLLLALGRVEHRTARGLLGRPSLVPTLLDVAVGRRPMNAATLLRAVL